MNQCSDPFNSYSVPGDFTWVGWQLWEMLVWDEPANGNTDSSVIRLKLCNSRTDTNENIYESTFQGIIARLQPSGFEPVEPSVGGQQLLTEPKYLVA